MGLPEMGLGLLETSASRGVRLAPQRERAFRKRVTVSVPPPSLLYLMGELDPPSIQAKQSGAASLFRISRRMT